MLAQLTHSRDGGAVMIAIDFGTHRPAKEYKMLVENGPTGLSRLQAASRWIPPPPQQGHLQGKVHLAQKMGNTHFRMGE